MQINNTANQHTGDHIDDVVQVKDIIGVYKINPEKYPTKKQQTEFLYKALAYKLQDELGNTAAIISGNADLINISDLPSDKKNFEKLRQSMSKLNTHFRELRGHENPDLADYFQKIQDNIHHVHEGVKEVCMKEKNFSENKLMGKYSAIFSSYRRLENIYFGWKKTMEQIEKDPLNVFLENKMNSIEGYITYFQFRP